MWHCTVVSSLLFRRKYVCGTSWRSTWGIKLTMSPAMWTSSLLQTPGGAFEENHRPPATWSAASLKFRLSLIAGWSYCNLFRLGVSKLTWDQWWEPVYTLCLPLRLSCLYLSVSVFTFSSSNNQSDGNCLKRWFNAVTFWENRSWAFKRNVCICLFYIRFRFLLGCPISCELLWTYLATFCLFILPWCTL